MTTRLTLFRLFTVSYFLIAMGIQPASAEFSTVASWTADGEGGVDTYKIFYDALGPDSIESPDIGERACNTTDGPHIQEVEDPVVKYAFMFLLYYKRDCDTPTGNPTRERIEIKAHDLSKNALKAFENDRMRYQWRFKITKETLFSKRFTHIFQLKSVSGEQSDHPLFTFTAKKDSLLVQHGDDDVRLGDPVYLKEIRDEWIEASVDITFSHKGSANISLKRLSDNKVIYSYTGAGDMFKDGQYVRPKWGIYRETKEVKLNDAIVYFADFSINRYSPQ